APERAQLVTFAQKERMRHTSRGESGIRPAEHQLGVHDTHPKVTRAGAGTECLQARDGFAGMTKRDFVTSEQILGTHHVGHCVELAEPYPAFPVDVDLPLRGGERFFELAPLAEQAIARELE